MEELVRLQHHLDGWDHDSYLRLTWVKRHLLHEALNDLITRLNEQEGPDLSRPKTWRR